MDNRNDMDTLFLTWLGTANRGMIPRRPELRDAKAIGASSHKSSRGDPRWKTHACSSVIRSLEVV